MASAILGIAWGILVCAGMFVSYYGMKPENPKPTVERWGFGLMGLGMACIFMFAMLAENPH